jgi:hypothetical protein
MQAPPEEKMEAAITKLAEFRNTLPEREQAMMDSLVARAAGQPEEGDGVVADAPSAAEVTGFAQKLEEYRDTLPEDDRILVDGMVIASGAVEEDVAGHAWYQAWSAPGHSAWYTTYMAACFARSGTQRLTFSGTWYTLGFGTYRCYDWR